MFQDFLSWQGHHQLRTYVSSTMIPSLLNQDLGSLCLTRIKSLLGDGQGSPETWPPPDGCR
jgi:hypothetical protein